MLRSLQLLLLFFFLATAGCRREESNPEQLDPIYTDLTKQQAEDEGSLAAEKKAFATAIDAASNSEPNTIDLRNALRDVARTRKNVTRLEQKVMFDGIRTKRRLAEDHLNYHLAFVAGKDWPDKHEYAEYLVNQRLLNAPRNWDARVPKLFQRKTASKDSKKKEPAAE